MPNQPSLLYYKEPEVYLRRRHHSKFAINKRSMKLFDEHYDSMSLKTSPKNLLGPIDSLFLMLTTTTNEGPG